MQGRKKIILGSNSPRRRELLAGLRLDFTVDTGNSFVESAEPGADPHQVPVDMSLGKSHGFHRPLEDDEILITADAGVIIGGRGLGKQRSREEAEEMLHALSGKTHEVVTAVTLRDSSREKCFSVSTLVEFCRLEDAEIDSYIDNFRPYDKAGAYGVQEWIGYVGISRIEGSFYNVMGLPVHRIWQELKEFL